MPSGDAAYERKQQKKEQQKAAIESNVFTNDFILKSGQYAVVRILEEGPELTFADVHRVPVQGKRGRYFRDYVCLDTNDDGTPCPACQHGDVETRKRVTRGFVNLIWRDAPVFQRDDQNRAVRDRDGNLVLAGREDQIAIWKCSWTVFCMLKEKDSKWKGLKAREWEIKRTGSTMNDTQWFIEVANPESGPQPMTIADLALAEKKYDLDVITRPLPYAELSQILNRGAIAGQGPQPTFDRSQYALGSNYADENPSVRASAFQRG